MIYICSEMTSLVATRQHPLHSDKMPIIHALDQLQEPQQLMKVKVNVGIIVQLSKNLMDWVSR